MKRFFKAIASATSVLLTILAIGVSMPGCTMVDDTLGTNFIPHHQQIKLRIDKYSDIDTYIARNDTIPASGMGKMIIGNYIDPVFGKVEAGSMTDFYPSGKWNDGNYFGFNAVADSIFMDLLINDIIGDPSVEQTFYIYALRDSLQRDSAYRINTPIETKVDMNKPLFSFTLSDKAPIGSLAMLKLKPTEDGKAFMQLLANVDSTTYATPWPDFHKKFYGFYFAPAPNSPKNAAVYDIDLRQSGASDYSGLLLCYHNYKKNDPAIVDTSTIAVYRFTDSNWGIANVNLNVNKITFEYNSNITDHLNDTLPISPSLETVYVQGLGGVASYVRFSDRLMDKLSKLKEQDGITYSDIIVDQARLYIPIDNPTAKSLDIAPNRLGMYHTYGQPVMESPFYMVTAMNGPQPMIDYAYYMENQPSALGGPVAIDYQGYKNRSNGYYQMIVTQYVTQLILNPKTTPKEIWIGPEINTRASKYSHVALKNSAQDPIKLVITYTLIR